MGHTAVKSILAYDCVIATRNRLNAIRMSIPLILKQDAPPSRLIVVDASDDHDSVRNEVDAISERLGFKNSIVIESDANSARQRNLGLQLVTAPIVMFPDDDSMWHEGFAANVLKIYHADTYAQIGGVGGVGVLQPPPELERPSYNRSRFKALKHLIQPYRSFMEQRLFPRPFDAIAASNWADEVDTNSKRLSYITGYRMSFRTEAVKRIGFDETLGYGAGYSYHEDIDISLRLQREGYSLVSAENAKVCHLSFPGSRGDGYSYGFCAIANCVYVCKKAMDGEGKILSVMERYLKYKLFLYASRFSNRHDRQVFHGAFDAWRSRFNLLKTDDKRLSEAYKTLCDQYINANAHQKLSVSVRTPPTAAAAG
jgi:GT2 family glycosyltransferase